MCGNIAKHTLPRHNRVASELQDLLKTAGYGVSIQDAKLAAELFFDWYFDDVFMFHSNQIVESLNDIRWRMFEYLQPEYQRSWHPGEKFTEDYRYHIPESVTDPFAQAKYWDVMNRIRVKPLMEKFAVVDAFKRPHHSEQSSDE